MIRLFVAYPGTLLSFLASRDALTNEESLLIDALCAVFESRVASADDLSALHVLMREVFPSSVRLRTSHSHRPEKHSAASSMLNDAVVTQLRALGLQPNDSLISKVRLLFCLWSSWSHCHSLSLASVKSRLVLPMWYWLTWVVLEKGPLNVCVFVCVWYRLYHTHT